MTSNIKAICFDLDGVYFTPEGKRSFHHALSTEFGATPESVDAFMKGSVTMKQFVTGRLPIPDFFDQLRAATSINASNEELTARWIRDYEIDPGVQRAVQSAKQQDFITCVCTNNNPVRLPALEERFGFYQDFDVVISSHEVGYTKPSQEIFEALLVKTGVRGDELLYSDDNPDRLQGARDLGINVFVYTDFDQFLAELQKYNINL